MFGSILTPAAFLNRAEAVALLCELYRRQRRRKERAGRCCVSIPRACTLSGRRPFGSRVMLQYRCLTWLAEPWGVKLEQQVSAVCDCVVLPFSAAMRPALPTSKTCLWHAVAEGRWYASSAVLMRDPRTPQLWQHSVAQSLLGRA